MSIRYIGSAWRTALKETSPITRNGEGYERFFIDFRGIDYPSYAGSPTFTADTDASFPGSHYLSGGYGKYLLPMPATLTLDVFTEAGFAYDTGSNQALWAFTAGTTQELSCYYDQATDRITVKWICDGTARYLTSDVLDATALAAVRRVTLVFDLSGTSALYLNGVSVDTSWSGATDTKSVGFLWFELRALRGTAGAWNIGMARLFADYAASAAIVAADFYAVRNEEIVWLLNGEALGRTRCNVTGYVTQHSLSRATEGPRGANANRLSMMLLSQFGEFADDQYAAFDPANAVYNGTAAQAYLTRRCRVMAECWYSGACEPLFVGRLDEGMFSRQSVVDDVSRINVVCLDQAAELGNRYTRRGRSWENYELAAANGTSSVFHEVAAVGTKAEIWNYLGKSDHPVTDSGSTWFVAGGTLSEVAESVPVTSANTAQFSNSSGSTQQLCQVVAFAGDRRINTSEYWTFSIWLKSAAGATASIRLCEYEGTTLRGSTAFAYDLGAGDNYELVEVSHQITNSASNRLRVEIDCANGKTILAQGAMLTVGKTAPKWLAINAAAATSAVFDADDAAYDDYDSCGFVVGDVEIVHPWARVERDECVWENLKQIGDATLAVCMGFDEGGALRLDARLATGFADGSSLYTVVDADVRSVESAHDESPNRLKVHGIWILKESIQGIVWSALASGIWEKSKSGHLHATITNGASWPDPAIYGEFAVRYGPHQERQVGW